MITQGCTTKYLTIEAPVEIHVPYEYKHPKYQHLDKGFYECGSKIHMCVVEPDVKKILHNQATANEIRKSLINIIEEHNRINDRTEMKCGFFAFKCRRDRNRINNR